MRANCHKSDINLLEDLFIAKHFNLPHHSDKEHFEMIPIGKIPSLQMFPSHHFYWRINYYKNDILLWCEISASAFRQVTIDWQLSSLLYHKWKLPNVIGSLFFTNMPRKSTSHIFCSSLLMMNQSGFFVQKYLLHMGLMLCYIMQMDFSIRPPTEIIHQWYAIFQYPFWSHTLGVLFNCNEK